MEDWSWLLWSISLLSGFCFVCSLLLDDYSIVDRLWSILPPYYVIAITLYDMDKVSHRHIVLVALTTLWGLRLTYNFYRVR